MNENYPMDGTSPLVASVESQPMDSPPKKPRTSEDFYLFCKFILEYENYDRTRRDEEEEYDKSNEAEDGTEKPTSNESEENSSLVDISSDDSYDLVTCFCQKPFAGRPMIECSSCFTWIHLRCVKIKKSEIPDIFICPSCKKRSKR